MCLALWTYIYMKIGVNHWIILFLFIRSIISFYIQTVCTYFSSSLYFICVTRIFSDVAVAKVWTRRQHTLYSSSLRQSACDWTDICMMHTRISTRQLLFSLVWILGKHTKICRPWTPKRLFVGVRAPKRLMHGAQYKVPLVRSGRSMYSTKE
jgi:hypothetical protein